MIDAANAYHEKYDKGFLRWKMPDEPPQDLDLTATGDRWSSLRSGQGVLGARAHLGWGEAAAFGGDGAALHAVRRLELDGDEPVVVLRRRSRRPAPGTCAPTARRRRRGPAARAGCDSAGRRGVLLPAANTDDSLSKVSVPS